MGNLSPHMLHNFHIIEPTRNCLINKASRKPSNSRRVKRHALVCQLILCMLKPLGFPVLNRAFHFLLGDIFSFSRRSFCGQLGAVCVCIHHVHLHASLVTSCATGAVARSAWISLIMTTSSFGHIFSVQKDWRFFLHWTSFLNQLWLFYRKD